MERRMFLAVLLLAAQHGLAEKRQRSFLRQRGIDADVDNSWGGLEYDPKGEWKKEQAFQYLKEQTYKRFECPCLNWSYVYKNPIKTGVTCGQGNELIFQTKRTHQTWMDAKLQVGDDICPRFFERLPRGICANPFFDTPSLTEYRVEQWCYVDLKKCPREAAVSLHTGWKYCSPGHDEMLSEKTFEELSVLSKEIDVDIGVLVKMAYPTLIGYTWEEVKPYWNSTVPKKDIEALKKIYMDRLVKYNMSMTFLSKNALDKKYSEWHPTFGVVHGAKAYEVQFNDNWVHRGPMAMAEMRQHPSKFTKLQCVFGCDNQ